MKSFLLFFTALILSGCSTQPLYFDGETVTYEHGSSGFERVMEDAINQCASVGKLIKHERTDCGTSRCASTFSCIDKP
jgi:hypothetical protein